MTVWKHKRMALISALIFCMNFHIPIVKAEAGTQPLQVYFSDDGKYMDVFVSEHLDSQTSVLIANETFTPEVRNTGVEICTTFLIDNSTSMPKSMRDSVKKSIIRYAGDMSSDESIRIALFDAETVFLTDQYLSSASAVEDCLEEVDFSGKNSYVYDAVLDAVHSIETENDAYYRTVLITDGADTEGKVTFDSLKSEMDSISGKSRCHIDVIQLGDKENAKLTSLAQLGSNTYYLYKDKTQDFSFLNPGVVSMLKTELNNAVTTGELKGVTIKNGDRNITIGSVLFPQAELEEVTDPPTEEETFEETTEEITTTPTEPLTDPPEPEKKSDTGTILLVVLLLLVIGGGGGFAFWYTKKNTKYYCIVEADISKSNPNDPMFCGLKKWTFEINDSFRVGRMKDLGEGKPNNHFEIYETASKSSIGRSAFSLTCNYDQKTLMIHNTAENAYFYLEAENGSQMEIPPKQSASLQPKQKILLGNYTSITINNFRFEKQNGKGR